MKQFYYFAETPPSLDFHGTGGRTEKHSRPGETAKQWITAQNEKLRKITRNRYYGRIAGYAGLAIVAGGIATGNPPLAYAGGALAAVGFGVSTAEGVRSLANVANDAMGRKHRETLAPPTTHREALNLKLRQWTKERYLLRTIQYGVAIPTGVAAAVNLFPVAVAGGAIYGAAKLYEWYRGITSAGNMLKGGTMEKYKKAPERRPSAETKSQYRGNRGQIQAPRGAVLG